MGQGKRLNAKMLLTSRMAPAVHRNIQRPSPNNPVNTKQQ
jgi:hypothetical protein